MPESESALLVSVSLPFSPPFILSLLLLPSLPLPFLLLPPLCLLLELIKMYIYTNRPKTPKMDKSEDPRAGLMGLMKQMYQDGDDDMKRTIAKAWHESQEKRVKDPGLPEI